MNIRPMVPEDYDTHIVPMWKGWSDVAPIKDFLPNDGEGGYIVMDEDTPVCAGYVYVTNSKVAWAEWFVTNVNYTDREKRKIGISLLLDTITNLCVECGYKYIFAVVSNPSLMKTYEMNGFKKGSEGVEMIKILTE